jgi:hypothetical protein
MITNALIVFCEGPHDLSFIHNILRYCFGATDAIGKTGKGLLFSEYPSPFNSLFKVSVDKHAAQDLSLDMAHKFFLPDKTIVKDDTMILLFNTGGKNNVDKIKILLQEFLLLKKQAKVFPDGAVSIISDVKYLFVYDADHNSPQKVAAWFNQEFGKNDSLDWEKPGFIVSENNCSSISSDKALFIWCGSSQQGTLEDILLPLYSNAREKEMTAARNFVTSHFEWDISASSDTRKYAQIAERNKAIICSAGQGQRPGKSLHVIINDSILCDSSTYKSSELIRPFIEFLANFSGI